MSDDTGESTDKASEAENSKTLPDEIDKYVQYLLKDFKPQKIVERKVIHDPIMGSNVFEPYEIALIDSPFIQRLRRISQTDVASLVYPSANHNRLEHSLNVATISGRILENLWRRKKEEQKFLNDIAWTEVRFAAILHDIGHGVFSHLSEEIYKNFTEIRSYRSENEGMFNPDSPHEMLSYLIIISPSFKEFFQKNIIEQYGLSGEVSLERIANSIIPFGGNDKLFGWQADIINGPFDADKFDYLQRDAYFSGLKIGIDLDRFLHCVWLESRSDQPRQLKIMTSGATTFEQILFGKLMLYNTIYHHQKIRAAECAVRGIFELINANPEADDFQINNRKMNRAVDFLYITEEDVFSLHGKSEELKKYIRRILNRDLFKRALVISSSTVESPESSPGYKDFVALSEEPEQLRDLACKLVSSLGGGYSIHDIWIDMPETLTFKDALFARIQDEGDDSNPKYFQDTFRISEWLTAYGSNKWKGYVFCPSGLKERKEVGERASELISEEYNFKFMIPEALYQAKVR